MSTIRDLIIIGAGPGGYVAAIRAAQLGLSVSVVERDAPGGVCLNWGCIPSKNLIAQAETYASLPALEAVGVRVDRSGLDYAKVHAGSRAAAKALAGGVAGLLKANRIEVIRGSAALAGPGVVTLDEGRRLQAKYIILATGSRPLEIPGFEFDEDRVLSSTGILRMTSLPRSLVILGGGAIGCEFAYVMNAFGVKVTLIEAAEHLLPSEDFECAAVLAAEFGKSGIDVRVQTRAASLARGADGVRVQLSGPDGDGELIADKALVVFGRRPNVEGLGLETLGIKSDARGYIEVGDWQQTSAAGVFAIGDLTATPALAHVASREGENAVEFIAGAAHGAPRIDLDGVPSAVYCEPQLAGFGLREDAAAARGAKFVKSVFPFRAIGKAVAVGKPEGLLKVMADPDSGEILGAHAVGHHATELIHELLLARHGELSVEDVATMIHAHPTLSEATLEAAKGVFQQPIHLVTRKAA